MKTVLFTAAALTVLAASAADVKVSSFGWNADDSTGFLQKALDSGAKTVVVDRVKGPWMTRPLFARSNQTILFEKGVELVAKKGAFMDCNDCLFSCRGVTNVTIRGYGATWRMHRADYDAAPYRKGEWRHSLTILGSAKVTVEGLTLVESGGDGVYVGTNSGCGQLGAPSSDVVLRDIVCDRHYRQGISVISARRLLIERCVMKNTAGTPPAAGIDFEPNRAAEELTDCVMRDCTIFDNQGNGIEFCFNQLDGSTPPLSLTLENCRVRGCGRSVVFSSWNKPTFPRGFVRLMGCTFANARHEAISLVRKPLDAYSVEFSNCQFANAHTAAPDAAKASDITLNMRNWNDATTDGIRFDRCVVCQPVARDWITTTTPTLLGGQVRSISGSVTVKSPAGERQIALDAAWIADNFREVVSGGMPPYRPFDPAQAKAKEGPLAEELSPLVRVNVRHVATYRLYAAAAGRVRMRGRQVLLGRKLPTRNTMTLCDSDGRQIGAYPILTQQEGELAFDVPKPGFYLLTVTPAANAFSLTAANVPVAVEAPESFVNFISSVGTLRFRKTADARAVLIFRGDGQEKVQASVSDPTGRLVWAKDGISSETAFVADAAAPSGLWTLGLKPPTNAAFEDCSILMRGLAPELFISKETW